MIIFSLFFAKTEFFKFIICVRLRNLRSKNPIFALQNLKTICKVQKT